jgi:YHS domain-containing protein
MKNVLLVPFLLLFVLFISNAQAQDKSKKAKAEAGSCCDAESESCDKEASASCSDKDHHKTEVKTSSAKISSAKSWNAVCPIQGDKVDPKVKTVKYNGKEYGFCCDDCIGKFKNDPAKYSKNLSKDGKTFNAKKS